MNLPFDPDLLGERYGSDDFAADREDEQEGANEVRHVLEV